MEGKLRLGVRVAVGVIVVFGILFAVVGQSAHRAGAQAADNGIISISGSPDVNEGSPATFTATIDVPATVDATVFYTATSGGVSGSFTLPANQSSTTFDVATTDNGFPRPRLLAHSPSR